MLRMVGYEVRRGLVSDGIFEFMEYFWIVYF